MPSLITKLYKTRSSVLATQPQRDLPIVLRVKSVILSNSDLYFSLGIEPVIEIGMMQDGDRKVPTYRQDDSSITYITAVSTEDVELSKKINDNSNDLMKIEKIINQNPTKIQKIDIPYDEKDLFVSGNKFKFKKTEYFQPLSFKESSNPQNLYIYAMVIRENPETSSKNLVSEVYNQQIISQGGIVLQNVFNNNIIDLRDSNFDEYLNFDIVKQINIDQKAYFSDLFYSPKKGKYVSGMFLWDKIQFLREMSLYGNILKNGSIPEARQKMIDDSRITEMKIIRKRVKKNIDGFSLFNKNQKNEVIIYSSEDDSGDFITSTSRNTKTGKIKSKIENTLNIKNTLDYVSFSFEDYAPQRINLGQYKYKVEVRLQDGMLKFLLDSLKSLREYDKNYDQYLNIFFFGSSERKMIEENVNSMLNILFSMKKYTNQQMQDIKNQFYVLLSSYDGFRKIIDFNQNLMTKISYALGKRGITNSNSKIASYKNIIDVFSLQDDQTFQEIVDFSRIDNVQVDYLGMEPIESIGLSNYSEEAIKNRFLSEFKKYIKAETIEQIEDLNFNDLNNKLYEDNTKQTSDQEMVSNLFDFSENFYTYLSPASKMIYGEMVKNNQFEYENYLPKKTSQFLEEAQILNIKGVRILTKSETITKREEAIEKETCSDTIFGEDSNINTEKTYTSNAELSFTSRKQNYAKNVESSIPVINKINSYYNNFNIKTEDYDLDNANNLLFKKRNEESKQFYTDAIKDMPNQLRAVFGSKSDLVRNKWNLTDNDFFANPESSKMMKENFSNLIRVEVLSGFMSDSNGIPNSKSPIFNKLRKQDFDELQSGDSILCKTYIVDDASLGIGQKQKDNSSPENYYNQYFIITKE
jgi:hypothetical protein